jgi:UDP-N-acetylglucosamine 4,6-dehydratase
MLGGELFVPKIPSMNIMDLAKAIAPETKTEIIGIRPGEKLHEVMISVDDSINTLEFDSHYVIQPAHPWWDNLEYVKIKGGQQVADGFVYSSDTNSQWLSVDGLKQFITEL